MLPPLLLPLQGCTPGQQCHSRLPALSTAVCVTCQLSCKQTGCSQPGLLLPARKKPRRQLALLSSPHIPAVIPTGTLGFVQCSACCQQSTIPVLSHKPCPVAQSLSCHTPALPPQLRQVPSSTGTPSTSHVPQCCPHTRIKTRQRGHSSRAGKEGKLQLNHPPHSRGVQRSQSCSAQLGTHLCSCDTKRGCPESCRSLPLP